MANSEIIKNSSIDCIIYSFNDSKLQVLLVRHAIGKSVGKWALPGGYVKSDEDIDTAAVRTLKLHTGLEDIYLEQLKAFGAVDRFPNERVITISYFSLVRYKYVVLKPGESVYEAKWFTMDEIPPLIFDHKEILKFGNSRLRHIVRHEPIGFRLLPEVFPLLQLQSLYEAILNTKFDKPNFRRKLLKMNFLYDTKVKQKNVSHRAANLFRFDLEAYEKLKEKGFTFDL